MRIKKRKSLKNNRTAETGVVFSKLEKSLKRFYFPARSGRKAQVISAKNRKEAEKIYNQ